jgi:hypothetical protein
MSVITKKPFYLKILDNPFPWSEKFLLLPLRAAKKYGAKS